jgi:hypothetical protein
MAITAAPSSGNQLAIASNDLVYTSANSGATFAPTGLGQNNNPFIYIPFDGSVTDVMGNATVTTTGSIAYVAGKVGTNALSLSANTAGGTASNYINLVTASPLSSFTASGWFNMQSFSATQSQYIFSGNGSALSFSVSTTGVCQFASLGVSITTSFTISANTWYQFTVVFQSAGLCSLYINGSLIGQATGTAVTTGANMRLGAISDYTIYGGFAGYLDDFRLYNYAVTNPSGAALINPIVGPIMPYVYLTFDGSTTTDLMGNSTVTATGSPGFVAGQVGSNAINFANTAGVAATRYVTGTWSGATNFTISLWLNYQTAPLSTTQVAMSLRSSGTPLFDIGHNTSGGFVQFYYGAGIVQFMSLGTLSINTWYRVTFVYQQGGTSSAYLNEQLITSLANSPALQVSPTTFELGSRLTGALAFNGYIDDFRIYNGAFMPSQLSPVLYSPSFSTGSPNIYLPFENGSVQDVMGYSAVSARGTMNFVPGVVGLTALNLVNPAGGTVVNYLRGSWAGSPNFTVSFWFNAQSLGASTNQVIFVAYSGAYAVYINTSNQIMYYLPSGGTALNAITGPVISINTWYYVTAIFQTNGTCSLYVNNSLAGTYTNTGGVGSYTTTAFGIATYDALVVSAFNGYIDDFKLYNCVVPFHALGPMNYTQAAINNTGNYQVVAAANGGVYTSANSGSSWSQATTSPQVVAAVNTVGGQVITPQLTNLAANTWTQNGVNWVASASSVFSVLYAYGAFNNYVGSSGTYSWGSLNNTYSSTTPFACTSGVSTTILGVGATVGEWLQIQTSVPLVIQSYSYTCGGAVNIPQKYYIVGSNDGSAWYPIQYASMTTNPFTANFQVASTYITVNQSGTQTITGAQTGSGSFTTYTTTTNAYTYFRILATNVFGAGTLFEFGELYINFITPPTPLYVAPSATLIANQSLSAINVMPQQTGLTGSATTIWTTNGISWVASSSSNLGAAFVAYYAFNGTSASSGFNFASASAYNTGSGAYTGSNSTTVVGITPAVTGEWLQIQSSVPLVLTSYTYGSANWLGLPKTGYWVGSNDGTTWYPLQSWSMTTNPLNSAWATCSTYVTMNYTGTQTIIGNVAGSGTFTSYSYTTQAYQYFRMIGQTLYVGDAYYEMSELYLNFTAYTPALLQSLTMSPTGQYMALTGAGAVAPQLTGLVANTWTVNGVTWTASESSFTDAVSISPFAFNNNVGTASQTCWKSALSKYSTSTGAYTASVSTTILGGIGPISGEWIQIQSSVPLILQSYTFGCATFTRIPRIYYVVGSLDGSNWYPVQYCNITTTPFTADSQLFSNYVMVNTTGIQPIIAGQTGSITTTSYSTSIQPFIYFRLITTNIQASNDFGLVSLSEWYMNFQSGPTFYSTDYGSNWTRTLSAATVPNANMLAISGNGQYSLQGYGQIVTVVSNTFAGYSSGSYTTPTFSPALSAAVGPVINAAISATGQYMVVLIQSTTNNVYYSTNYGVSFTGLTVGSSPMVSCAISADGSYITVSSATQVYTLNWNTQGFAVTIGSQAGVVNQGQNAIAIGNQAGVTNQSAGSIILNSSGSAVNSYFPGFFVSPIALAGSSVSGSFAVLGYGSDNQVVQSSSFFIGANGNVGIGTTNPGYSLDVVGTARISGAVIIPYVLWHFNWSSFQYVGIVGSSGMVNSINNTNIAGTYINTPSPGQFTVPYSGLYLCTFDATSTVDARSIVLLRINGLYYNPYATSLGNYAQMTYTDVVYLTAGQVVDWYCSLGGVQYTNVLIAGNGSGKGISFTLIR